MLQIAIASVSGFDATCPAGSAAVPTVPLASAFINVTVLHGFDTNASIPYGNGTTNATVGGLKWNIDAQGW